MEFAEELRRGNRRGLPDRRTFVLALALVLAGSAVFGCDETDDDSPGTASTGADETAPAEPPSLSPDGDLLDVIAARRSVREFEATPVSDADIALMLWAAQGVTDESRGFRAAPSAGALYPLELYVADASGLAHYLPDSEALELVDDNDVRRGLAAASLAQGFIATAPVVFVMTGVVERTAAKYGARAERYVHMEAGHAAQNLLLVATQLGLGGCSVGAFVDEAVGRVIGVDADETPLYVIPVGVPR
jgi:SagB-type dehydrogenase family enzyme